MKRMIKKLIGVLLVGILLAGVGTYFYVQSLLKPVANEAADTVVFVIARGESFTSIAKRLHAEGLLVSPWSLKIANYLQKDKQSVQAGSFRLSPAMTPAEILGELAHGKIDMWVKLLEGWRREEMADELANVFAENNLSFDTSVFLAATKNKEGYLFPDSYLLPLHTSETAVAELLENTLTAKLTAEMEAGITKSGYTLHQVLTMASIIEREARSKDARRMVSGILWKRVSSGWPLQADATLQYAKGFDAVSKSWWKPPLAADKELSSPYNTYAHTGLPPGPICAPSLDSIEAAIFPRQSTYWYYITDTKGVMHYAETLEQHNANVAAYLR